MSFKTEGGAVSGKVPRDSDTCQDKGTMASGGFSLKAPEFSGVESFSRFKSDLDTYYTIHNFNDDLKLRFLPLCLKGVARDAYEALSAEGKSTYNKAVEELSNCFVKPCALDAHAKLRNLKFDSSMSLDSFIIQFKHLMSVAFPGPISDQVLFHSFLPTLPVKYQEHIISLGLESFEDSVSKVRNLIRSERIHVPVRQVSTDTDLLGQLLERIEVLERRVSMGVDDRTVPRVGGGAAIVPVMLNRPGLLERATAVGARVIFVQPVLDVIPIAPDVADVVTL